MADNSQSTEDLGTNTQTARSVLLKRNPHLRVNDTASPSFGGLGTRQFLQKQLMTPGSATSASSFEEGASYDGFSDAGTPASEESLTHLKVGTSGAQYVSHTTTKQPTKRLSSPSRASLARRLMGASTENGMLPDDESESKVREEDNNLLNNLVIKTVPSLSTSTSMVPLSPRSTKVTRRIVASPRKTLRRVVIRKTGTDGRVHEEVQYVDTDGQVVQQGGNFFNGETEDKSADQISTPAKTLRRVVVRRTGADGQVHEEVQFLDADGNVVEGQSSSSSTTSVVTSTPIRSSLTRRTLRRTGPDGNVYEQIQFLDAEGNVVKTQGDDLDSIPSSSTVVTRTVTPGKKIRRVIIRRTGADGQMHEEVQYLDAEGNVVSTEGSQVNSGGLKEEVTTEGPDSQRKSTVTRRVVRRILVRKDGTRVEQLVDVDGNVIEGEGGNLVSAGSFTGSVSSVTSDTSTGRRVVTRRVVASPVRRTVVHNTGSSSSGAESEDEIQYEGGEFVSSQRSGRRIVTRRVVTPQRVVRRMVTRKGVTNSDDELDIDAEFVHSEGNLSSDESIGGSSRGYTVSDRIVIPGTTRVVSRDENVEVILNQSEVNTVEAPATVAAPQEGKFSLSAVDESAKPLNDTATALENSEFKVDEDKSRVPAGTDIVNTATIESNAAIPAVAAGVGAAIITKAPSPEVEPVESVESHPTQAEGGISVPKTPVVVDQPKESGGGFWGFFGKSEEPNDKKTAPVETETLAAPSYVEETVGNDTVQPVAGGPSIVIAEELATTRKSDIDNSTAASNDPLEDKTPVESVQDDAVDVPEPSEASESNNVLHTAAVASVTTAAVVHDKDVEAQDALHPVVTTTEEPEPANVPRRKKARSIWKFWGGNTPSPIRAVNNTTNTAASGLVVTETAQTTVVEEEFESGSVYHDAVALTASQHSNGHQEAAVTTSVATVEHGVEIEAVRRSISSTSSPTNVVPVESSGKFVRESERRTTELMDGVEPEIEADDHYVEIASPRHLGSHSEEEPWAVKPCSLSWQNLHLKSKNGRNPVLDGVSGSVKAGEFLVITGPSKHESLALLSCLAGFEDAMQGNVTVNGRKWNDKMNRYVAFVMREDLFFETLTVYEHLLSQAKLRMRRTHTDDMLLKRVERVIEDLELSNCRDKLIGGGISLTGITPVERKLLALATALLTNPSILLVEEPTDGLDTFSSEKIVSKLRWLAFEKGLTVAVTLHHPSSHFYVLFDVLYLVTNASCVYDGKASDAVGYFSTIGYSCPEFMSPMDYFLLQIGGNRQDDDVVARIETLKREWRDRNASVYAENEARAAAASEDVVVDNYDEKNRFYHMSCCGQLGLLWMRHVRRLSRYGFVFWWHLLTALLIGVVFGLVYLQLDLDNQHSIQNFAGSFFYIVVIQLLFTAYRTFVFMPRETAIALRERQEYRGGWYHLLCWYLTKIVAELPALIILSLALFVPVFLLVGIGHGFKVYVYMQIVLVLAGWSAIGLGFLSLGVFRDVTLALIVFSVLLVLFVAFGGLLINVADIPDWLVWLHYISPVKYAYEAMMKIFWKRVDSIDCDWTLEGCVALTGKGVLKYYSMENRSALGDSLILLAIGFAFFFFAFWFLLMLANNRISGLKWRYDWSFKGFLGSNVQRIANGTTSEKHAATRTSTQRVLEGDNYYIQVETPRINRGTCDAPGITLGWSSLSLKTEKQQHLLTDASGSAKSGELVLITGPSDESTVALLESLGGLQKRMKGKMTLNGVVSSAPKVSDSSAYVVRDDFFYETLTVEEHLKFQSELLLASYERVEMVLDELELTGKRHMLIRYLSPADTKLLAVATALLTNPSILLVEEPTSGMDFYASQFVVLKLRQLARGGRTVVVSMAHPSSHIYALFDTLYLLAGGAAVYHGKVREAVSYFASLGYQCPQYMSPVDYFVRQLTNRGKESEKNSVILFKEAWSTRYSELNLADSEEPAVESVHRRRIGCCSQFSLLFRRHLLRLSRYRVVFGWHALWMVVLGVIFGLIFLQLDLDEQRDIQNWAGAFFYLIVLQMLVIAYRTFVFLPKEMAVAEREHRFGGYFMVCWYLTKLIAELPALLVLSVLLFVPAYLLIGIGHGFKLFLYMQFVMWLAGWSAAGLVTLLLGLFRRVRVALITFVLLLLLFVAFGGLLINVDDVPDYLIWLHYISPIKYGYEALMKLFWGRIFFLACGESDGSGSGSTTVATVGDGYDFGMSGSGSYGDDGCIAHSGDEVLAHYSMDNSRSARSDSVILLELAVLYFFIGYVFLSLRWRRYKREQRQWTQN